MNLELWAADLPAKNDNAKTETRQRASQSLVGRFWEHFFDEALRIAGARESIIG